MGRGSHPFAVPIETGEQVRIDASGQRRSRSEAAAVRAALEDGQVVAFANRHQRYHFQRRGVRPRRDE